MDSANTSRILLLGGSGLLSVAARKVFLAAGHAVTVTSRLCLPRR